MDLPANEKLAGIDLILNQIFRSSTTQDLLNYRLVSHNWNYCASKELRKRTTLTFFYNNFAWRQNRSGKPLTDLTASFHNSDLQPHLFPSTNFTFISTQKRKITVNDISDEVLQDFLNCYGPHIVELCFRLKVDDSNLQNENVLTEQIKTLIVIQAPNLRYLSLSLPSKIEPEIQDPVALPASDPEFKGIHSQKTSMNTKLQVLKLQRSNFVHSAKMVETIIQIAPNLDKIIVDPSNYLYFLEPINRLHLLKNVVVNPGNSGGDSLALYEKIGGFSGLQLRHITINLEKCARWTPEYKSRVASVISKLFASSWNSLETVRWDGVAFLTGMELPLEMPKVWKLQLTNLPNLSIPGGNLFPEEFEFGERFPNLKSVGLLYLGRDTEGFLDRLCFKPVSSVRRVQVSWKPILATHFERIGRLFPLAKVNTYEEALAVNDIIDWVGGPLKIPHSS